MWTALHNAAHLYEDQANLLMGIPLKYVKSRLEDRQLNH